MKVSINYDVINNDKARDAFFAATTFTVEKGETVGVVLKRPFIPTICREENRGGLLCI